MKQQVSKMINKAVDKAVNKNIEEGEPVRLLKQYIEDEATNAEVISVNIDRLEALEEKVEKLEQKLKEVN